MLVAITGCSAEASAPDDPQSAAYAEPEAQREALVDESLDRAIDGFFSVSPDLRFCAPPACGGYFVRALNVDAQPAHVSKLIFDGPGLDDRTVASIREAPLGELVLFGRVSRAPASSARAFLAREVYRGLPGKSPDGGDGFYGIGKRVPSIACFTTPCPNQIASLINEAPRAEIDRVAVDGAAAAFVDKSWIVQEIERDGAIVAGRLNEVTPRPGEERLLLASQVFLRLPERPAPCVDQRRQRCDGQTRATFLRMPDRCLVFDRCVEPAVCQDALVTCAGGYTLISWAAAPSGCPEFACDPAFTRP